MTSSFFCLFWTLFLNTLPAIVGEKVLIWEENFDGDSLNDTVWTLNTGNGCDLGEGMCGWGNDEQQTYTTTNHLVADGFLTITAKREDVEVDERWYTSSRIRSKSPVAYLTGRIEARMLLPAGLGLWAAFWMLPTNDDRGLWAASGEIDILEAVNDMDTIVGTIHYGGEYPDNLRAGCRQSSGIDFSVDFHTYAIEWQKEEMSWYVDEQLYCHRTKWSSTLDSLGSYRAPFDAEFELLVNLAIGGTLPGRFVDDTALPASMLVDYIRVYDITSEVTEAEPYLGVPACLPGFIEAEAYDIGGLGLGYGDSQPEGSFGTFRTDGTGLVETNGERTYVANLTEGDWTAYIVMTDDVVYDISLEVRTAEAASLHLLIGDDSDCSDPWPTTLTGDVAVDSSGSDGEWNTIFIYEIDMPAGTHSLKLCVTGGVGMDVDRITFNLRDINIESVDLSWDECGVFGEGRPYMFNKPWAIPGYIEAEYYDRGGPGVGFYKTTPTSNSGYSTLRLPDGVDVIEAGDDSDNGHYVGYWEPGEWLAFTSRAELEGEWNVAASIASGAENTLIEFRILLNANNCSLPETDGFNGLGAKGVDLFHYADHQTAAGSWEDFWLVFSPGPVVVPQGDHRVMFCADSGYFNLNYLSFFTPNSTPVPTPSPGSACTCPSS